MTGMKHLPHLYKGNVAIPLTWVFDMPTMPPYSTGFEYHWCGESIDPANDTE